MEDITVAKGRIHQLRLRIHQLMEEQNGRIGEDTLEASQELDIAINEYMKQCF